MTHRRRGRLPKPQASKVSVEQRETVVTKVRGGLDPEAALAEANIDEGVARADPDLMKAVASAFKIATAKMRAKLIERAINSGEAHILERAVAARDAAAQEYSVFLQPDEEADESCAAMQARLDQLSFDELRLFSWVTGEEGGDRPVGPIKAAGWRERLDQLTFGQKLAVDWVLEGGFLPTPDMADGWLKRLERLPADQRAIVEWVRQGKGVCPVPEPKPAPASELLELDESKPLPRDGLWSRFSNGR